MCKLVSNINFFLAVSCRNFMTTYDNIFYSLGVVTGSALVKDKKKEKVLARIKLSILFFCFLQITLMIILICGGVEHRLCHQLYNVLDKHLIK